MENTFSLQWAGCAWIRFLPSDSRQKTELTSWSMISHSCRRIPSQTRRADESSELAKNVSDILRHTATVMSEAKEYVYLMADQALVPTHSSEGAALNRDGKVSWKSIIPYSAYTSIQNPGAVPENIEVRFLDSPKVAIAMNEQIAGVCFPDLKGRLDMSMGFRGSSLSLHKWCYDFFNYCWKEAEGPRGIRTTSRRFSMLCNDPHHLVRFSQVGFGLRPHFIVIVLSFGINDNGQGPKVLDFKYPHCLRRSKIKPLYA